MHEHLHYSLGTLHQSTARTVAAYLDPLDALQLRVDDERPAFGIHQYRGILGGHAVAGQSIVVPLGNLRVVGQQRQRIESLGERDRRLDVGEVRDPVLLHEFESVGLGEVADVGDEGGGEKDVAGERLALTLVVLHRLGPAHVLRGQPAHQTVGQHDRLVCRLGLGLQSQSMPLGVHRSRYSITVIKHKKLSYRRGTAQCVVSVEILPNATQQCSYDKS